LEAVRAEPLTVDAPAVYPEKTTGAADEYEASDTSAETTANRSRFVILKPPCGLIDRIGSVRGTECGS